MLANLYAEALDLSWQLLIWHQAWWNKSTSGGPIVEQATHLVDLSLLLAGAADLTTVHAQTVEHNDNPGGLSKIGVNEKDIPPALRLPRYTAATWRYVNGGVGTLTHAIALHGNSYESSLEIIADGALLRLEDPYGVPKLNIRLGNSASEVIEFPGVSNYTSDLMWTLTIVTGRPISNRNGCVHSGHRRHQ
jgi:predicted dehydrogenase